jgi:IS30 family transposase
VRSSGTPTSPPWVERSLRLVILVRDRNSDTESIVEALSNQMRQLLKSMDTLSWGRGTEMANHQKFTIATDVKVYFCDPKSP